MGGGEKGGGGGEKSLVKGVRGMPVVLFSGEGRVKCGFLSHLGCSGENAVFTQQDFFFNLRLHAKIKIAVDLYNFTIA